MLIDGKDYGTSSVSKGLARHRLAHGQKAKEASDKAGHPVIPTEGEGKSAHDHQGQEGGHEVIQQVHDEHGPASKVEVKNDGEHHAITTTHEDGHEHTSSGHPSVAHVHEHIGHAAGASADKASDHGEAEPAGEEGGDSISAMLNE